MALVGKRIKTDIEEIMLKVRKGFVWVGVGSSGVPFVKAAVNVQIE